MTITGQCPAMIKKFPIRSTCKPVLAFKRKVTLSAKQREVLENVYAANPYPDSSFRQKLSVELGMKNVSVAQWFTNKRAQSKHRFSIISLLLKGFISYKTSKNQV